MIVGKNVKTCTLVVLLVYCSLYVQAGQEAIEITMPYVVLDERPPQPLQSESTSPQGKTPLLAAQSSSEHEQEFNAELNPHVYRFRRKKHMLNIIASTSISTLATTVAIISATSAPTDDFNGTTALLWTIIPGCVALSTAIYSSYHGIKLCKLCRQRRINT